MKEPLRGCVCRERKERRCMCSRSARFRSFFFLKVEVRAGGLLSGKDLEGRVDVSARKHAVEKIRF